MNTKLHAITDQNGRPLSFFMTTGQVSDYTGASALLDSLPMAQWMLADRGYDADWSRDALEEKGIRPCTPGRRSCGKPVKHDKRKYKCRNRIEIMFGRVKDWRQVATRSDRCPRFLLGNLPRCNRHLLAMNPEPRSFTPIRENFVMLRRSPQNMSPAPVCRERIPTST